MINSSFLKKSKVEYLSQFRILKKNTIHIKNIPKRIANIDLLESKQYFGQYGKIIQFIMIYKANQKNNKKEYSAYITYSNELEAALAILDINSLFIEGKGIPAFFLTLKFYRYFLNNKKCPNIDKSNFLHNFINDKNIINDKDIVFDNNNPFSYQEHLNFAKKIFNDSNLRGKYLLKITHATQKLRRNVFTSMDLMNLNEEKKEKKYFTTNDIGYIKSTNNEQNDLSLTNIGVSKRLLTFNKSSNNNKQRKILSGLYDFVSVDESDSNYTNNKDKLEYAKPGNLFENNNNALSSIELHNIFKKSINHILVTKPLYMALKNVNMAKLELEYFLNDLSNSGVDIYELLDGCLEPISHLL